MGHDKHIAQAQEALEALRTLPLVSQDTLAALQELRLPLGRMRLRRAETAVQEAVRQAHALRRAWDLGTLDLSYCNE